MPQVVVVSDSSDDEPMEIMAASELPMTANLPVLDQTVSGLSALVSEVFWNANLASSMYFIGMSLYFL